MKNFFPSIKKSFLDWNILKHGLQLEQDFSDLKNSKNKTQFKLNNLKIYNLIEH